MIRINLIPPEYIERINHKAVVAKAVLAAVVVVAVIVLASLWQITRAKTIESSLAQREVELKALQKDVDQVKAIEAQISEVQRYLDSISSINKGRFTYTHFLQDLTSDLPSTIWFNGVNTSVTGGVLKVDIGLNSNSAYDLAYWINYLETSGQYSEVTVGAIAITETEEGKRFATQLTMKYAHKQ
jgi:Tfp pilus assembly protein PilN